MSIKDLINAVKTGDVAASNNVFNSVMSDKMNAALDLEKQSVASTMIKDADEVSDEPVVEVEAEMLLLNQRFWTRLGLDKNVSLQLNNIGDSDTRAHYKAALVDYLSAHKESLDADSLRRLDLNPMEEEKVYFKTNRHI